MKRSVWGTGLLFVLAAAVLVMAQPAAAQGSGLRITLARTFGYSSGADIQGTFAISASGPADVQEVTYYMDAESVGQAAAGAPWRVSFETGRFAPGPHTLRAEGRTASGATITSNTVAVNVLSSSQAGKATVNFAGPLIGIIVLLVALATGGSAYMASRNARKGSIENLRHYGIAGGTICPKCGRPYALSAFSPNMLAGKLSRCPFCGKWTVARRASLAALEAAAAAEAADAQPQVPEMSDEEKLRRQIEEARYR